MRIYSGPDQALKRYLTLFYGITLGLALLLAILAISFNGKAGSDPAASTQTVVAQAIAPTQGSTEVHSLSKPTAVPPIPPTPNEETPSPLGVSGTDLQGVQVTLWHPWSGSSKAALQNILDEFNLTNQWGIHARASSYNGFGALDEAVDTAIMSGTLPEVVVDYGYQAQRWNGDGVLADLTPYVDDPVWGLTSDEQADFYPEFWKEDLIKTGSSSETIRLGIPFYRSAYLLFYNQSWARELGFSNPPTTVEQFTAQACAAAGAVTAQGNKSDQGKGGWLITPQPGALAGWIYAFGGQITNPNAEGYLFNTPQTEQAFESIKGWVDKGCAWSDAMVDAQSEFANRQALFRVGSLFDIPAQQQALSQAGSSDHWAVIPFPSRNQAVVDTYGPSLLLTRSTPEQQLAAWLVVKWLLYPPNQAQWVSELGTYPTRQSTLNYLDENAAQNPMWAQALSLLPVTRSEPSLESWSEMRWALNDALGQLIDLKTTSDQIPTILENLNLVAADIYDQVR